MQDSPPQRTGGRRLKILIYGLNFTPELTGVGKYTGEMAAWLAQSGHRVRVVTAPPYYPSWKVGEGFSAWWYSRRRVDGVRVMRAPLYVPQRPGGIRRVLHLLSYAISSAPLLLAQWMWRPDVVWVAQPTLFCAPGALVLARLAGSRSWVHVQDFEVNAGFGLGLMRGSVLRSVVLRVESWLFRRFDRISTISPNMAAMAQAKTGRRDVVLFPNWVDTSVIRPNEELSAFRERLAIAPDQLVLLYSGNMGNKQGLSILGEIARKLSDDPRLVFVFCGEGSYRAELESLCNGLTNVRFLDLQPAEDLNALLGAADVHLLPQRADASDLVLPSKLTGILASGRPVIATAPKGSGLAEAVEGCGCVVDPEQADALADAVSRLADDRALRESLGARAREKAVASLSIDAILPQFESLLLGMFHRRRRHQVKESFTTPFAVPEVSDRVSSRERPG